MNSLDMQFNRTKWRHDRVEISFKDSSQKAYMDWEELTETMFS